MGAREDPVAKAEQFASDARRDPDDLLLRLGELEELLADEVRSENPNVDLQRRMYSVEAVRSLAEEHPYRVSYLSDVLLTILEEELDRDCEREDDRTLSSTTAELTLSALRHVAERSPQAVVEAVPTLLSLLESSDLRKKQLALETTVFVSEKFPGELSDSVDLIAGFLSSDVPEIEMDAVQTLGHVADEMPEVVAPFADELAEQLSAADLRVQGTTATTLCRLACDEPEAVRPHVDKFVDLVDHGDPMLSHVAVETLLNVAEHDPASVAPATDALVARLKTGPPKTRAGAGATLGMVADERPDAVDLTAADLADVLGGTGEREEPPIQVPADSVLTDVDSKDPAVIGITAILRKKPALIDDLVGLVGADDGRLTRSVLTVLGNVAVKDATHVAPYVPTITPYLRADRDELREVASEAVWAVVRARPDAVEPVVGELVDALQTDDVHVQVNVMSALGVVGLGSDLRRTVADEAVESLDGLLECLETDAPDLRANTLLMLAGIAIECPETTDRIVERTVELLDPDETELVTRNAAVALARISEHRPSDVSPVLPKLSRVSFQSEVVQRNLLSVVTNLAPERPGLALRYFGTTAGLLYSVARRRVRGRVAPAGTATDADDESGT